MRMISVKSIFLLMVLGVSTVAKAQQLGNLNLVHNNLSFLNPAHLGSDNRKSVFLDYRKQWTGINNSPEEYSCLAEGSFLNNKIGLGVLVNSAEVGLIKRTGFGVGYRYRVKLNANNDLNFGLYLGAERSLIDFERIIADDPSELLELQKIQAKSAGKAGLGITYRFKKLEVGANGNLFIRDRLTYTNPVNQEELSLLKVPDYNFFMRIPVKLGQRWVWMPSVVLLSTQGLPLYMDAHSQFAYNENFQFGLGYRQSANGYVTIGYEFLSQLELNYAYQYNFSEVATIMQSTHEIGLKFYLNSSGSSATINKPINNRRVDELQEKLDQNNQDIKKQKEEIEKLDKNVEMLEKELKELKRNSVKTEEVEKILQQLKEEENSLQNKQQGKGSTTSDSVNTLNALEEMIKVNNYQKININTSTDIESLESSINENYQIIVAVYKNLSFAKSFKKRLKRDANIDTRFLQVKSSKETLYFVAMQKQFSDKKEAAKELLKLKTKIKKESISIINGDPWMLQGQK